MISFVEPSDFEAALQELAAKHLLPTDMGSAEIRQLAKALRERSLFSARTTKVDILQTYREQIAEILNGDTNLATGRARVQDMLDALRYDPKLGFPDDEDLDIPPATPGSLRALNSNMRVDLVLRTNMQQVANHAFKEATQTGVALKDYPCYELRRLYPRAVPRGFKETKAGMVPVEGEDWPSRWAECDGEFYDGRMIARKDDPIWGELGDSANFDDALDTDVPPFAFNSGYGWREVSREECLELGVIDPEDDVEPTGDDLNAGLSSSAKGIDPGLLKAAIKGLNAIIDPISDRLKLRGLGL